MIYKISKSIDICLIKNRSLFLLKSGSKIVSIFLPSLFFFKSKEHELSFLFTSSFNYKSFISHYKSFYSSLLNFYFLKIRLKGLGYRIKKITNSLFRFYFNKPNFFYFHVPNNIIFKIKGKVLIFLGMDFFLLRQVVISFFLLKKQVPYRIRGIVYPRQIIILKPGKKTF